MTINDLWQFFGEAEDGCTSLLEELNRTSYDERMEIDLRSGKFRIVDHVHGKYAGILTEGDFNRLYQYAVDNFVHPDDSEDYRRLLNPDTLAERLRDAEAPGMLTGKFRLKGADGSWIWTRQLILAGADLGLPEWLVCCYVYDVRQQKERSLGARISDAGNTAHYEEVTGLLEGTAFFRAAQQRLPELGTGWCVMDVLIDHYKHYTDWYGLESSRYLLSRIGEALRVFAERNGGMPGYLGQEEFCLLAPYDETNVQELFDSLQEIITSVSLIEGFSPIIGIAPVDGSSTQLTEYFNHAALTAETMRGDFRTRIAQYDAELHRKNAEEYRILCEFQSSLDNGDITFFLQPQVRASSGKIVGAESLARWRRSDGSLTPPPVFIPVLEKYGLITQLDMFIWEEVCRWQQRMKRSGRKLLPISVNVSQKDISSLDIPSCLSSLLERYELPASCLKVEITESSYAGDYAQVREITERLQELGFTVLMDDFGSGYSSLNMLRSLNMDVIKLDAQFLQNSERKDVNILESIINMTKNLSTPIIVEGVETAAQMEFLEGLGCRYMQGFHFYRPMPAADFEELTADERRVDLRGFQFKANQQLTVREFMDENVFTDTMLNNVLGPVVFYRWDGAENIDIIRFNEQFYELVGIESEEFHRRKDHIQNTLYPGDEKVFTGLLAEAVEQWAIGSRGVVRSYRPNGALVWLNLRMFYMYDDAKGKVFYASAQDITETQVINSEMPGAYYRCSLEENFEFLYISRNFQKLTGFSEREIRVLFDNCLVQMVHPADVPLLRQQAEQIANGTLDRFQPYRIRRRQGDYIYVAEHSQISDRFGALCWQCMVMDVSEVMRLRNQMRVLSRHLNSTVLFLHRREEELVYEAAVHGLSEELGMDAKELEESLNSGAFCKMIQGYRGIPHQEYTELFVRENAGRQKILTVTLSNGNTVHLNAAVDRVEDDKTRIEYIVVLRVMNEAEI